MIRKWVRDLASHNPVIIAIDDMHWISKAGLRIFAELSQDVKRLPILLVGIFRTFELQSEDAIASSLISIARTGRLWRMELSSLTEDETKKLISAKSKRIANIIKKQDFGKLYRYCAGVPLYAVELAQFLEEGRLDVLESTLIEGKPDFSAKSTKQVVPPLLIKITKHRLSKLTDGLVHLLKSTSLLMGHFSLELISSLVSQEEEQLENNLVELEQRNFLHHTEGESSIFFSFNHQMVKLAISQSLSTFERRRFYKDIVKAIQIINEDVSSVAKAYYYYNSGDHTGAIPYLLAAAESWLKMGDKSTGLEYSRIAYKVAMERFESQPNSMIEVIHTHSNNLVKQKSVKEAINVYSRIIDRFESTMIEDQRNELLVKRDELKKLLRTEHEDKRGGFSPLVLVSTKRALASTKLIQNDREGAVRLLDDAERTLDSLPDSPASIREAGMVLQVKAKLAILDNNNSEALRLLSNAMELLLLHGTSAQLSEMWRLYGEIYKRQGRFDFATEALRQCEELAEQNNDNIELTKCHQLQGELMFEIDNLEDAELFLRKAIETGHSLPELTERISQININLARLLIERQKKVEARQILKRVEDELRIRKNETLMAEIQVLRELL